MRIPYPKAVKPTHSENYYFQPNKKGEIAELCQLLRNQLENESGRRLSIVQRVIEYMTMGFDVSKALPQMCMISQSQDLKERKLVYLFMSNYAHQHPDIALMAINTFLKGCSSADNYFKAVSLRALAQLRIPSTSDFLKQEIIQFLNQSKSGLKRAGVLACIKLFLDHGADLESNNMFIDKLYEMIRDPCPIVMTDCVMALQLILHETGGIVLNWKLTSYLANRLCQLNQFCKSYILEVLLKYSCRSQDETLQMMNLINPQLKSNSSAVILATNKLFLSLAKTQKLKAMVLQRIGEGLMNCLSGSLAGRRYQESMILVRHILYQLKTERASSHFSTNYRILLCRNCQPAELQTLKMQCMGYLASTENIGDIIYELTDIVGRRSIQLGCKAVQTLRDIGYRLQSQLIIKQVLLIYALKKNIITDQCVKVLKDLVFRHQEHFGLIQSCLEQGFASVSTEQSQISLLLIMFRFSEDRQRNFIWMIQDFLQKHTLKELGQRLKRVLITVSCKLYLQSPVEGQDLLIHVLRDCLQDQNLAVRGKALYYQTHLKNNRQQLKQILAGIKLDSRSNMANKITDQHYNSLVIAYGLEADTFTRSDQHFKAQFQLPEIVDEGYILKLDQEDLPNLPQLPQETVKIKFQFLTDKVQISPQQFAALWERTEEGAMRTKLNKNANRFVESDFCQLFQLFRVYVLASGDDQGTLKFFVYSKLGQKILMCEITINEMVSLTCKSSEEDLSTSYARYLQQMLQSNDVI